MSKDYFILNQSKVVYKPGHYDEEDALKLARTWSCRYPGRLFTVVKIVSMFRAPRRPRQSIMKRGK